MNIQQYLKDKNVFFTVHLHPETFDSQHLAQQLHEPGKNVVKTVLLHANHGFVYVVAVLPATHHVDLERLSTVLGHTELHLATIDEIARCCPDCESGVLPPFGSKFDMKTIVDESLAQDEFIVMQGNTRHEAIRLEFKDYYNLERPLMASFAVRDGACVHH
jgi:Ala-tRNA(Pro) deacylase